MCFLRPVNKYGYIRAKQEQEVLKTDSAMLFYLLGDFLSGTGMLNCDFMSVQCPVPM